MKRIGAVAAAYAITAALGLRMDAVSGFATLVWPPTGIAIAAVFLFGYRMWPAVAIGAFAVNAWSGAGPLTAAGIAAGNTSEALLGAFLLSRVAGFRPSLTRPRDVLALVVFAAGASTTVSASVGVASLWLGGLVASDRVVETWRAWWLGDAIGALVVAPMVFGWRQGLPPRPSRRRVAEAAAVIALESALCAAIFFGRPTGAGAAFQQAYVVFPALLWAALRFGPRGAVSSVFLASVLSIWGTALGGGPFVRESLSESLFPLQVFMGVLSVTTLLLGALVADRERAVRDQTRLTYDLAARERRAEAVQLERDAVEVANRELEAFSHAVAHDLRAPLRAISGFSEILLEEHAPALGRTGREHLDRVRAGVARMQEMIDALLQLSDVTRSVTRKKTVDISAVAAAAISQLRAAHPDREVSATVADGLSASGDPRLLRILLENLLGNAWKFTSGRAKAHVEVGAVGGASPPIHFVRDDGAGFDMKYVGGLFQPFKRLHRAGEFAGTGIGLATARRIVHKHGGRVWAESEVGRGATFFFTLEPQPAAVPAGRSAEAGARRILLVEDTPSDTELTRHALSKSGIVADVVHVADGAAALDYLFERGAFQGRRPSGLPSVVLLDLKIPKVHGLDVLRALRGDPRTASLPVVVLSASSQEIGLVERSGAGVAAILGKPADAAQLAQTLRPYV